MSYHQLSDAELYRLYMAKCTRGETTAEAIAIITETDRRAKAFFVESNEQIGRAA